MSSSRRRPERRLSIAQGRDAREIQLPPSAGKCFLLTSPFIERVRHIILRSPGLPRPLRDVAQVPLSDLRHFRPVKNLEKPQDLRSESCATPLGTGRMNLFTAGHVFCAGVIVVAPTPLEPIRYCLHESGFASFSDFAGSWRAGV